MTRRRRRRSLKGVFGTTVQLQGGATVVADEAYIRESIVNPQAKVVAGFQPIMPTFQGLVTEEQLLQLIAYVRSLKRSRVRRHRPRQRHRRCRRAATGRRGSRQVRLERGRQLGAGTGRGARATRGTSWKP